MEWIRGHRFWILLLCVLFLIGNAVGGWLLSDEIRPAGGDTSDAVPPVDSTTTTATTTTTSTVVPSQNEDFSFTATVMEVGEDFLLVQADAGGPVYGEVRVLLEQPAAVSAGDRVRVWHTGQMMPSLPPQMVATRVEKIA